MPDSITAALEAALASGRSCIGQVEIRKTGEGFHLQHRDDSQRTDLQRLSSTEQISELVKFDDAGKYRPLKTAPNLRHGWQIIVGDSAELARVVEVFYPGRLGVFHAREAGQLQTTSLRETLNRQTGMYRVAANISDAALDDLIGSFCRSDGGCLRTILWKRDAKGTVPSSRLPAEKYDPSRDQVTGETDSSIPLLCQEACNLLVAACRETVKGAQR